MYQQLTVNVNYTHKHMFSKVTYNSLNINSNLVFILIPKATKDLDKVY